MILQPRLRPTYRNQQAVHATDLGLLDLAMDNCVLAANNYFSWRRNNKRRMKGFMIESLHCVVDYARISMSCCLLLHRTFPHGTRIWITHT